MELLEKGTAEASANNQVESRQGRRERNCEGMKATRRILSLLVTVAIVFAMFPVAGYANPIDSRIGITKISVEKKIGVDEGGNWITQEVPKTGHEFVNGTGYRITISWKESGGQYISTGDTFTVPIEFSIPTKIGSGGSGPFPFKGADGEQYGTFKIAASGAGAGENNAYFTKYNIVATFTENLEKNNISGNLILSFTYNSNNESGPVTWKINDTTSYTGTNKTEPGWNPGEGYAVEVFKSGLLIEETDLILWGGILNDTGSATFAPSSADVTIVDEMGGGQRLHHLINVYWNTSRGGTIPISKGTGIFGKSLAETSGDGYFKILKMNWTTDWDKLKTALPKLNTLDPAKLSDRQVILGELTNQVMHYPFDDSSSNTLFESIAHTVNITGLDVESAGDKFTITLPASEINGNVILVYYFAEKTEYRDTYSNKITINGTDATTTNKNAVIDNVGGTGNVGGNQGDITVYKQDISNASLSGAKFELHYGVNSAEKKISISVDDNNGTFVFKLPPDYKGKTYYLKEVSAPPSYETLGETLEFKVSDDYEIEYPINSNQKNPLVTVSDNKYAFTIQNKQPETQTGKLTIEKAFTDANTEKHGEEFQVVVKNEDGYIEFDGKAYKNASQTQATATKLTIKKGADIELTGLPLNKTYIVEELLTEKQIDDGYSFVETSAAGGLLLDTSNKDTASITVTNKYAAPETPTGKLTVKKAFTDANTEKHGEEFQVVVKNEDGYIEFDGKVYKNASQTQATATRLAIKKGADIELSGLPLNKTYEVEEIFTTQQTANGYSNVSEGIPVKVESKDGTYTITVTNKYEEPIIPPTPTGSLSIVKAFSDANTEKHGEEFQVVVKTDSGYLTFDNANKFTGYVAAESDATPLTIKQGTPVKVTGLDLGKTYSVEELLTQQQIDDGYSNVSNGASVNVTSDTGDYTITVTNKYEEPEIPPVTLTGSLTIRKALANNLTGPATRDTRFDMVVRNGKGEYLRFKANNEYDGVAPSEADATVLKVSVSRSVTVTGLPLNDTYSVEEWNVPEDYMSSIGSPQTVTDSDGSYAITVTNTYYEPTDPSENRPQLVVYKRDLDGNAPIEGAAFQLTYPNGTTKTGVSLGSSGAATFSLEQDPVEGSYSLVETAPATGYKPNSTPIRFQISLGDSGGGSELNMTPLGSYNPDHVRFQRDEIALTVYNQATENPTEPPTGPTSPTRPTQPTQPPTDPPTDSNYEPPTTPTTPTGPTTPGTPGNPSVPNRPAGSYSGDPNTDSGYTPIGDSPVPLADLPDLTSIFDDDVPLANLPRTGAARSFTAILTVAMLAVGGALLLGRRKED